MKEAIHPDYQAVRVACACGHEFDTRSTLCKELLRVDVCNVCHPFYTGKHKMMDMEGRVDKFMRRYAKPTVEKDGSGKH